MRRLAFLPLLSLGLATALACGPLPDAKTSGAADPGPPPEGAYPEGPPSKPWKTMTLREKKDHMKFAVMPKLGKTFQDYDKSKYELFTCVTCHGPGAKNGVFVMPSSALPKLDPRDGFKKHVDDKPEMTKFMMEKVMPDMIEILGAKPYDPATGSGMGCNACHTLEK